MRIFRPIAPLAILVLSGMAAVPARAEVIIANGSFEPPVPAGSVTAVSAIGAWQVTDGNGTVDNSTHNAQSGAQFLFLPGTQVQNSVTRQPLSGFIPGVEYEISYWLCEWNIQAVPQQCSIERTRATLKGRATAQLPVDYVEIKLGAKTRIAKGTNAWKLLLKLENGTNRIRITATDIAGTKSKPVTRVIQVE